MNLIKSTERTAVAAALFSLLAISFAGCANFGLRSTGVLHQQQNDGESKSAAAIPSAGSVEQPGPNEVQIVIDNFAFVPSEITITPGTKVTWVNKDEAPHTATSTDKKFNSGGLDTDDKWSLVFNDRGEFPYFCALHPHMTATITVK
jgi:plastocyanin